MSHHVRGRLQFRPLPKLAPRLVTIAQMYGWRIDAPPGTDPLAAAAILRKVKENARRPVILPPGWELHPDRSTSTDVTYSPEAQRELDYADSFAMRLGAVLAGSILLIGAAAIVVSLYTPS